MKILFDGADVISDVTRKVVSDFNAMSDTQFMAKYFVSKSVYFKRLAKYGDPYMKAPLARVGKFLTGFVSKRSK